MSGWGATEKGGEAISAWEFRTRYLAYGEKHDEFFCPFCDIRLAACLIYTDGELSKSPHFSAKWGGHLFGCDGEPLEVEGHERKPPKAHYIPRGMQVPEALIDRPPPRIIHPKTPGQKIAPPTSIEVSTRRKNASSLGEAVPKTHLLQPIVEAFNITLKEMYGTAKEKNWDNDKRNDAIKKALIALPLRLEDRTNYEDAFRRPTFLNWEHPRIYYASGFIEARENGFFVILSKTDGKVKREPMTFKVVISDSVDSKSPKSHFAILTKLQDFAKEGSTFRWYAYGKPVMQGRALIVTIDNLDHIYLKNEYNK